MDHAVAPDPRASRSTTLRRGARLATALALCLAAVLGAARPVAAQSDDQDGPDIVWSVQPSSEDGPTNRPFFVYEQPAGTTLTDYVAVTNLSDIELVFDVYASDAYNDVDGGYALRTRDEGSQEVGTWIRLGVDQVTIPANSRADIPFSVVIPNDAGPGDHAGGIVASLRSSTSTEGGDSVDVEQRVGTRVYLRVPGELRPSLTVDGLTASHSTSVDPLSGQPVEMTFTVSNTGNVRLSAHARAVVDGPFGRELGEALGEDLPELLPGSTVERTLVVDGVGSWVRMDGSITLEPFSEALPDGSVEPVTRSATLWSIPWLLVVAVVALIGGLVYWRRRSRGPGSGPASPSGAGGDGTPPIEAVRAPAGSGSPSAGR